MQNEYDDASATVTPTAFIASMLSNPACRASCIAMGNNSNAAALFVISSVINIVMKKIAAMRAY